MKTIFPATFDITLADRIKQQQHRPLFILFTGFSGSGKTTYANRIEKELFRSKIRTYLLDGDNLRSGLNKDLLFSPEDRRENLRRMAELSKLFLDAGMVVLAAFIAPLKGDRSSIQNIIGKDHYMEVYVDTPLAICEQRDVKGLYKRARAGEISQFTGISAPYEAPEHPGFVISHQEGKSIPEIVKNLGKAIMNSVKL